MKAAIFGRQFGPQLAKRPPAATKYHTLIWIHFGILHHYSSSCNTTRTRLHLFYQILLTVLQGLCSNHVQHVLRHTAEQCTTSCYTLERNQLIL